MTEFQFALSIHTPAYVESDKATSIRNSRGRPDPDMPNFDAMSDKELWAMLEDFARNYALDIRMSGGMALSCFVRAPLYLDIWLLHKRDSNGKFPPLGYYSGHPNEIEHMERSALKFLWERRHLLPRRKAKDLRKAAQRGAGG